MQTTASPLKTGGLKEKVRDALLAGLRRHVEDLPKKPALAPLKEKQQSFLLDENQLNQYVLGKEKPDSIHPIQQALVDYLRSKVGGKPKRWTVEQLQALQRRCLLSDKALKDWVIEWWEKRREGSR